MKNGKSIAVCLMYTKVKFASPVFIDKQIN